MYHFEDFMVVVKLGGTEIYVVLLLRHKHGHIIIFVVAFLCFVGFFFVVVCSIV